MRRILQRYAAYSFRRPKTVLGVAAACLAVSLPLAGTANDVLVPLTGDVVPNTESHAVREAIRSAAGHDLTGGVIALVRGEGELGKRRVEHVVKKFSADPAVAAVAVPLAGRPSTAVAQARTAMEVTLVIAYLNGLGPKDASEAGERLEGSVGGLPGVSVGGSGVGFSQGAEEVAEGIVRAELLAVPLLMLLSLVFFRGLIAGLVPSLIALLSIVWAAAGLHLLGSAIDVSVFALNIVTALALALSIDFGMLIVARYREEMARSGPGATALERTFETAGRTVFFSALTVAVAQMALLIFPQPLLVSIAIGGILVAVLTCAQALLILPAVLAMLGTRINAVAPARLQRAAQVEARPMTSGSWYRLSRWVVGHAPFVAPISIALLGLLALPLLSMEVTRTNPQILPDDRSAKRVDDILKRDYPPNFGTPAFIVVDAPPTEVDELQQRAAGVEGIRAASAPKQLGESRSLLLAYPQAEPFSREAQAAVRELREMPSSQPVLVGGETAAFVDEQDTIKAELLVVALVVLVLTTALVLFCVGSLVLAVKAVLFNGLSVLATVGLTVALFQSQWFANLLGFQSFGAFVDPGLLVYIAVMSFALSTDYGIIVLARIREEREAGRDDREAIAAGIERTGRVVSTAALLFSVAFLALATGEMVLSKEVGIGLGVAALIDALIVRAFLVPSTMALLGRWNWWSPRFLHRFARPSPE